MEMLEPNDYVGVTFWIISAAMVAAAFSLSNAINAEGKWKTSLTVAAMVTGIATVHYFYMRGYGSKQTTAHWYFGTSTGCCATVPLQIVGLSDLGGHCGGACSTVLETVDRVFSDAGLWLPR